MVFLFTKRICLFFLFLFVCQYNIKSQGNKVAVDTIFTPYSRVLKIVTVRSVPKFLLELNVSYNAGAMELSAHNGGFSSRDFILGKSYCARNGFGVNLTGKLPLGKKGKFWLDVVAGYSKFASDLIVKNDEQGKVSYSTFSGGFGAEYNFTPYHKLAYYTGVNLLMSVISGKGDNVQQFDNSRIRFNVVINPSVRIGYTFFAGMNYAFDKNAGINFGVRFTHANLLLKKNVSPSITSSGLNDDYSDTRVAYSGWKQFAYTSAYIGLSYYFGVKENSYKLP